MGTQLNKLSLIKRYAQASAARQTENRPKTEGQPPKATVVQPAEEESVAGEVKLSDLRIITPLEDLRFTEEFEAEISLEVVKPTSSRRVSVELFGTYKGKEENLSKSPATFYFDEDQTRAAGTLKLFYHKDQVNDADITNEDMVEYHLVAKHSDSAEECKSEVFSKCALESVEKWVAEIPDTQFADNSVIPTFCEFNSFVDTLKLAFEFGEEHEDLDLVIISHTSASEEFADNFDLSETRGKAIKAILTNNEELWKPIVESPTGEDIQRVVKNIGEGLSWGCDPGTVDGKVGPKTKAAVKIFQRKANTFCGLNLVVDGDMGKNSWKAVLPVVCTELKRVLEMENSLPELKFGYAKGEGVYACGESFPIPDDEKADYKSKTNRRIELVYANAKKVLLQPVENKSEPIKEADCSVYQEKNKKVVFLKPKERLGDGEFVFSF